MITAANIMAMREGLLALALALPRMLVCMLLVPVFASGVLTKTMRVAVAAAFALPVWFGMVQSSIETGGPFAVFSLIMKEAFIGLLLGFSLAMPFWAINSVGALLDNQRGANAAQQNTPFGEVNESLIGAALQQAMIAFLAVTGGLSALYQLLLTSYRAWPVLSPIPDFNGITVSYFIERFSELCQLAMLYALPLLVIALLVEFCFALMGMFATQLQVSFAAPPVKSLVGIYILVLYLNILLGHGSDYFFRIINILLATLNNVPAPGGQ